jgi:hypothetical protein
MVVDDANITYGKRNQNGTLPAITYLVTENDTLTVGTAPLKRCKVTFDCYASEAQTTAEFADAVKTVLVAGTYSSFDFEAVINNTNIILQEPKMGDGEETIPNTAQIITEIYYKEP